MELISGINIFNSVNASEPAAPQPTTENLQAPLNVDEAVTST